MNGTYNGKQMGSGRSGYLSDRDSSVGPLAVGEDVAAYRKAFEHALGPKQELARPRAFNMPAMIEAAALNTADMMSVCQRLSRIASGLGKHVPMKGDGAGPVGQPQSLLDQLDNVNNVQRDTIANANTLLMEIEQALGM